MNLAIKLYEDFHKYPPTKIGDFPDSFFIPEQATFVGPALYVLYRSAKCDPITYIKPDKPENYIHEHKSGVKICIVDSDDGPEKKIPQYVHRVDGLTFLGKCLGFGFIDHDGDDIEAKCTSSELYAIPSGKALLVVEKKKKVTAIIWGGKLNVEPRGIVG